METNRKNAKLTKANQTKKKMTGQIAKATVKTSKHKRDFRSTFMKSLLKKKGELEETFELLMDSQKEYEGDLKAGEFMDNADKAQREISAESHYSMIEKLNIELQGIENLLSRVNHEEEFGVCEACGVHIPHKRLLAVPEARLCINCQQELEESEHGLPSVSGKSFAYRW